MNSMNLLRILATNEKSTPRVERYSHTANPKSTWNVTVVWQSVTTQSVTT